MPSRNKKKEQAVRLKLQYSHMQRITLIELDIIKLTLGKGKLEALLKLQIKIYAIGFDSQIPASKDSFTSSSDATKGTITDLCIRFQTILSHETTPVLLAAPRIPPKPKPDALETYGEQTEQGNHFLEEASIRSLSLWENYLVTTRITNLTFCCHGPTLFLLFGRMICAQHCCCLNGNIASVTHPV